MEKLKVTKTHVVKLKKKKKQSSKKNNEIFALIGVGVILFLSLFLVLDTFLGIKGSGIVKKEKVNVTYSNTFEFNIESKVTVRKSDKFKIEVEAENNIIDKIAFRKDDDLTKISFVKTTLGVREKKINPTKPINIIIYTDSDLNLKLNSDNSIDLSEFEGGSLSLDVVNSATIRANNVKIGSLKINVDGGLSGRLNGSVDNLSLKTKGDLKLDGEGLTTKEVVLESDGSTEFTKPIIQDVLSMSINGNLKITYEGKPEVSKTGGGNIEITEINKPTTTKK